MLVGVGLFVTFSTWTDFLGRKSTFYMELTDADDGFRCLRGLTYVVSGGLQSTHTVLKDLVQWCPDHQKGGNLEAGENQHSCWIWLTQRIYLSIHKQSLEQAPVHELVAMCVFDVQKEVGSCSCCCLTDLKQQAGCKGVIL